MEIKSNAAHSAMFAKVFGDPVEEKSCEQAMPHPRYLTRSEWRMLARALYGIGQLSNVSLGLGKDTLQDPVHTELRGAVAHFLSGSTDLTAVIRECDYCLERLTHHAFSVFGWHKRVCQRRFIRHLRSKCFCTLQAEVQSGGHARWIDTEAEAKQKESFFI